MLILYPAANDQAAPACALGRQRAVVFGLTCSDQRMLASLRHPFHDAAFGIEQGNSRQGKAAIFHGHMANFLQQFIQVGDAGNPAVGMA